MTRYAYILGQNSVKLWGLTPRERLARQLAQCGIVELAGDFTDLPADAEILLVNSAYVLDRNTLLTLLGHPSCILRSSTGGLAAAFVSGKQAAATRDALDGIGEPPAGIEILDVAALTGYDGVLRKNEPLLLELARPERRAALESMLYGNSYKGITDLVTKWLWPRPARLLVKVCVHFGITPNAVTLTGLLLVITTSVLFAQGAYASGLFCGWIMTLLDTVDGKLARVTIQGSRIGHWLDHGMDIVHPPIWYVLWGVGLQTSSGSLDLPMQMINTAIVGGYLGGRIIEAAFHAFGKCSMFAWRPFDAYFRLVTARRNPCLIILTTLLALGSARWALLAVLGWTLVSSAIMFLRLIYAGVVRLREGPLDSWLKEPALAARDHAVAYRRFAGTRSAYA